MAATNSTFAKRFLTARSASFDQLGAKLNPSKIIVMSTETARHGVPSSELGPCSKCATITDQKCEGCRAVFYCSTECVKYEQHFHDSLCKTFHSFKNPPVSDAGRGILLPVDSSEPRWAWVHSLDDVQSVLGLTTFCLETFLIGEARRSSVVTRPDLRLNFDGEFTLNGAKRNKSIAHITRNTVRYGWRGPVLVIAYDDPKMQYRDVEMVNVRQVVDFFRCYSGGSMGQIMPSMPEGVQAVKIACDGESEELQIDKFTAVEIPQRSPLFENADRSDVSQHVGHSMLVMKCRPNGSQSYNLSNSEAAKMMMNIDPKASDFGWAPMKWQTAIGSVIVAREDRGPLGPIEVEALSYFCDHYMQDTFETNIEVGWTLETKHEVLKMMSPEKYQDYYGHFIRGTFVDELD